MTVTSSFSPPSTYVKPLRSLAGCTLMEHLVLFECAQLSTLEGLEHCTRLKQLRLMGCLHLCDITALSALPGLQEVYLTRAVFTELCSFPHTLRTLILDDNIKLSSIEGLRSCSQLTYLGLRSCNS